MRGWLIVGLTVGLAACQTPPGEIDDGLLGLPDHVTLVIEGEPAFSTVILGPRILFVHRSHPWLSFEVDVDDTADLDHVNGIVPIIGDRRLEGQSALNDVRPFLTPTFDAGPVERVRVVVGERLLVEFYGPPYSDLGTKFDDPDPILMSARVGVEQGLKVVVDLEGLYYIRPSAQQTTYRVIHTDGELTDSVNFETGRFRRYINDVRRVEVDDRVYGEFSFDTDVLRLQFDYRGWPWEIFEFDFDHSWKDRGQKSVATRLVMQVQPPAN